MQQITISGYLAQDAQVRKSESGTEFLTFNVGCRDSRGNSTFYPCSSFQTKGKLPSLLVKGAAVIVTGEMQIFDSEKDGMKYKNFRIAADRVWFAPQQKASAPSSDDLPE